MSGPAFLSKVVRNTHCFISEHYIQYGVGRCPLPDSYCPVGTLVNVTVSVNSPRVVRGPALSQRLDYDAGETPNDTLTRYHLGRVQ